MKDRIGVFMIDEAERRGWLKPGGHYLAVNYMITDDDEGPPFPCTREELWRRFSPDFELLQEFVIM